MTTDLTPLELKARLKALGLFGLISCCDEIIDKPWLRDVLAIEERERQKRGLERRTRDAHVGATKPMIDSTGAGPRRSTAPDRGATCAAVHTAGARLLRRAEMRERRAPMSMATTCSP